MSQKAAKKRSSKPVAAVSACRSRRLTRRRLAWLLGGAGLLAAALVFLGWRLDQASRRHALRLEALQLVSEGNFVEAEPKLLALLEHDPADVEVLRALALGQKTTGRRLAEGERYVSLWCAADVNNPEPFRERLYLWMELQRWDRALADVRHLRKLAPQDRELCQLAARLYVTTGQPEMALQELQHCLSRAPRDKDLRVLQATAHFRLGDLAAADKLLTAVLNEDPGHVPALQLRGLVLCEQERYDEAIPVLRRALAANDERSRGEEQMARYQLSLALARTGKPEEAAAVLKENRRIEEVERTAMDAQQQDDPEVKLRAARGLLEIGRPEKAKKHLDMILAKYPHHAGAHAALADYFERSGQTKQAAHHRRMAQRGP